MRLGAWSMFAMQRLEQGPGILRSRSLGSPIAYEAARYEAPIAYEAAHYEAARYEAPP